MMMDQDTLVSRLNEYLSHLNHALATETDRGIACVGDALIDEALKAVFAARLIDHKKEVERLTSDGQPLGSHGSRLRLAYCLGWIGPKKFRECSEIHRIRNKMAHELDVNSFDHEQVRDLVDQLRQAAELEPYREYAGFEPLSRREKFRMSVFMITATLWTMASEATRPAPIDEPDFVWPRPSMTEPKQARTPKSSEPQQSTES